MDIQCVPASILGIITAIIAGFLTLKYPAWDSKKKDSNGRPNKPRHEKWFYAWLIGLSALGGFWALFLPLALNQKFEGPNADGNQLRLHLLYITGGVLALTTLGETHRKNTVDREKAKVEKDNYEKSQAHQVEVLEEQQRQFNETIAKERERIEVDKDKNEQDHIRQVHAERRSRYTTAIEQLADEKAPIRLGGIYTLIKLVDEWLADKKTLPNEEEPLKEGQIIINSLCAYIRSPFDLASKHKELSQDQAPENYEGGIEKFSEDQGRFHEEQGIRLAIMQELRNRIHGLLINDSGPWSNFNYDFTKAKFFYNIDLSRAVFTGDVIFNGAEFFEDADFTSIKFITDIGCKKILFNRVTFKEDVVFENAEFFSKVYFTKSTFIKKVSFISAKFTRASFGKSGVAFTGANFMQKPEFWYYRENLNPARFKPGSENDFSISRDSSPIDTEEHHDPDGTITIIPRGTTTLFYPDDPSEQGYFADEYDYLEYDDDFDDFDYFDYFE